MINGMTSRATNVSSLTICSEITDVFILISSLLLRSANFFIHVVVIMSELTQVCLGLGKSPIATIMVCLET
jgi:hypothetical protein